MRTLRLAAFLLLLQSAAVAQQPVTGLPPFGSFEQGGFDTINRQNLNVNFTVPLVSTPGRGTNFTYALVYDSLIWYPSGGAWARMTDANGNPTFGWKTTADGLLGTNITFNMHYYGCDTQPITWDEKIWNYVYTDPQGTRHPFAVSFYLNSLSGCPDWNTQPRAGYATDGSGYYLDASSSPLGPIVRDKSGRIMGGSYTDTNGNSISKIIVSSTETDWVDTTGRTAIKVFTNVANTTNYIYTDPQGNPQTISEKFTSLNIKTNFACSGISEYTGTASLPTEIDLPNGQKYTFSYEPTPNNSGYYTGRLQRVTLPGGGYYEYDYSGSTDGISCSDSSVVNMTRNVNDGSTTNQWTLSRSVSNSTTTITYPQMPYDTAANQSVYTFNAYRQEIARQIYQGASTGTPIRTINTTWNGFAPATTTIILDDNEQSEIDTTYDSYGNLTVLKEHGFATGAPGPVVRTTTQTLVTSSQYTNLNIVSLLQQVAVQDSSGAQQSLATYTYDDSGSMTSCPTGALQHNDTGYGCSYTTRGNLTSVTQYTDPVHTAGPITHHFTTDWFGNTLTADADCCQKLTAAYSATTQYAYPDSVTRGISPTLQTQYTWNTNTGQLATVTDENTQGTTYSYDLMKRLTGVQGPLNQQTTYTYVDSLTPPSTITAGTALQSGAKKNQVTYVDGLGRAIEGRTEDAANTVYSIVDTQYDPVGRVYQVSNPYTSTAYWTQTRYDALGRTTYVIPPDGSASSNNTNYLYSGSKVTVTDPTGKQKLQQADALGRLASVYEPDVTNNNSLTVQTSYTYDVGNRLTGVSQGSQTRAYVYDGLGRQTSVTTPETGNQAFQYQYNNYGLLTQRTDARGVVTTYSYDSLNRPYQTSYNVGSTGVPATATVTLSYGSNSSQNNNGRLITMSDGTGSESYTYDQLGRVTQLQKTVGGVAYTIGYGYNYASKLTSITYPSGRQITQTLDGIGRLTQIAGSLNSVNTTYASAFGYNPAAEVTRFNYGNGVAVAFTYDSNRLLLQSLAYSEGGTNLFSLSSYGYTQNGGNNGQITSITDAVDSGRSAAYTYDALGRLSTAATQGSAGYAQWGLSWTYDRYGNRTAQTVTAGTAPPSSLSFDVTKNRINSTGYTYDKNGNLTVEPLSSNYNYTYDAENRLVAFSSGGGSGTYAFDGKSLRVQKTTGGATAAYIFSGSQVIAEYANGAQPSSPSREYIYSGSQLLAKEESGTQYYLRDHLSVRVITDSNGNKIGEQGHFPFGESWYQNNTTSKWSFTSYELDSESGNDYAMFRSYSSRQGRFLLPDPLGAGAAGPSNPQSWNEYVYALNDPVGNRDPLGLYCGPGSIALPDGGCGPADGGDGGDGVDDTGSDESLIGIAGPGPGAVAAYWAGIAMSKYLKWLSLGKPWYPAAPVASQNPPAPAPCSSAGSAPSPSAYEAQGQAVQNMVNGDTSEPENIAPAIGEVQNLVNLVSFSRGGLLDAQQYGAAPAYANYVFGVYMSAAGFSLSETFGGANWYAANFSHYGPNVPMDPNYPATPAANIANITNGYNAQQNGTLCSN